MKKLFFLIIFLFPVSLFADIYMSEEEILEQQRIFNALPKCKFSGIITEIRDIYHNECSQTYILQITTEKEKLSIKALGSPNLCDGGGTRFFPYTDKNYNEIRPYNGMQIYGVANKKTHELLLMGVDQYDKYFHQSDCSVALVNELFENKIYYDFSLKQAQSIQDKILSDYFYYHYNKIFYSICIAISCLSLMLGAGSVFLFGKKNRK